MHIRNSRPRILALALTAALAQWAVPGTALAQSNNSDEAKKEDKSKLQTVTVTAERRVANVQKTSIAMEVVTGSDIAEQGLTTGTEILKAVSNVEVQGAARGNIIAMRGVGSDMPPGMGESSVSTNYDGVYNFRAENATLGFFDLERVEVLRGPQGTLYGRNAAAGAVNFVTQDPVIGRSGGQASLEVGNYNLMRGEVGFNIPVNDMIAIRASAAAVNRDGFLTDGFNDAVASGGRLKVLFKPNNDLRILAGVEAVRLGGKGVGMVPDSSLANNDSRLTAEAHLDASGKPDGAELVGYQSYRANKTWLQVDANVGFGTLTVIPSMQQADGDVYRKWDASHRGAESWNYDPNPARQKSLEARLSSNPGGDLQWVVGAYYYDMLNVQTCFAGCGPTAETRDTTKSNAFFGQGTWSVAPDMRVIAGLRSTSDKKTNIQRPEGETWSSTDGKLALEFDLAPTVMAYASYATAYRPGGFNTFNSVSPRFDAEQLKSLELGIKSRMLDNTLQFNGALFAMDYTNYQAIDNYLNPHPATPADFFLSNVLNVPKQNINGIEAELQYAMPSGGKLRGSVTYLDATLGDLRLHDFGSGIEYSMKGNPLPHSPKTTFKAGVEQPFNVGSGSLTLRGDVRYTSEQYTSISENPNTLQAAVTQVDLSAQYRPDSDKWGINFYVKNATNVIPQTAEFFGYSTVGTPRTYGFVVTTTF